jgi:mutator protein MutT
MIKPDIHKAAGIIIQDRKLLMLKSAKYDLYLSPGGKIEAGETPVQALIRELAEEISIKVEEVDLSFFAKLETVTDLDPNRKIFLDVFFVNKWQGEIVVANEIEAMCWINSGNQDHYKLGSIFAHNVIPRLKSIGLID